jgi:magnesium chelatase subunit I
VVRRRDQYESDPAAFARQCHKADAGIRQRIVKGRQQLGQVRIPDDVRESAARLCMALGTDGLRGDLTLIRAARAVAALQGDAEVGKPHLRQIAASALRHRLRRNPLDDTGSSARVQRVVAEQLGA